jgi:putative tricarboxylic transport membrane protein
MMPRKFGGTADFWSGLALAALGTYIIFAASRWEYLGPDGPGPGFFPLWYGIAMAALSGALVVSSVWRERSAGRVEWREIGRALAVWLALAVSVAALKPLGFVMSFAALTFFIAAVMYRRPPALAAVLAVANAAAFYVVFSLALGVPLPAGVLGF